MKKAIIQLIIGGSLLTGTVGSATAQYRNPLRGQLGVHDPVIIKEKQTGTYWVFATGGNIACKSSRDKITWNDVGGWGGTGAPVPSWIKDVVPAFTGTHFWAPDVQFRDNKYWLYYSLSTFGENTSAIALTTSPTLTNPTWSAPKLVVKSNGRTDNYNAIDPAIFTDDDGKVWLSFGSFWSGLKLVECDPATGVPAEGAKLISIANHPRGGIEAPYIAKWGYYYLFVSWDKCCDGCNSTYKIVVGRSENIEGPYLDKKGKDMLDAGGEVIDAGDDVRKGPGHNGIFIDNDTLFCVNHYYACGSTLQIRPLYFDDGWPSFTGSVTAAPTVEAKKKTARPAIKTQYGQKVRVAIPLSGAPRSRQAGQKTFTITGKALPAVHSEKQRTAPQGIVIIDSKK